jgi:hypothetical protein
MEGCLRSLEVEHDDAFPGFLSLQEVREREGASIERTADPVGLELLSLLGRSNPTAAVLDQFGDADSQANFVAYRFHSTSGRVVKSFLALRLGSGGIPVFTHVSSHNDLLATRVARGLVATMGSTTYLIGQDGEGLEMIALPRTRPRTQYAGLTLSQDEDGYPICSRLALVRTSASDHNEANIGIYDSYALPEFQRIRPMITNELPLEPAEAVSVNGRTVSRAQLSYLTHDLLSADGVPRMTFPDGTEFNPANEEDWLFNAALTSARRR